LYGSSLKLFGTGIRSSDVQDLENHHNPEYHDISSHTVSLTP